ncbi:MAG: hypothetical protein WCI94_14145 [Rhodospirillales bacterium]
MRVALLYSGLPRMWRACHATQLALFPGAEIDVFFHFWDTVDRAEKQAIVDAMRPKSFVFEAPRDYGFVDRYPEVRTDRINIPSRLVSQYMSWRKVATQFQPYAPRYDLAVRSRSDLYFFDGIRYDLANVATGGISLVAYRWPEDNKLLSDMFAIGKPRAIVYFHSLIDTIWNYVPQTPFNPEALITRHLAVLLRQAKGAAVFALPDLPCFVFRPHMVGWTAEQCMAEGPGVSKWRDPEVVAAFRRYHGAARGAAGLAHVDSFISAQTD